MADIKAIFVETGTFFSSGVAGFGIGCFVGSHAKSPVLMIGVVYAISTVVVYGLKFLVESLAEKYNWNLSTVKFLNAASAAVIAVAFAVTTVALGIFSPVGAAVPGGIVLLMSGVSVGMGLYAKFGEKDPLYSEALKNKGLFYLYARFVTI